MYVDGLTSVSTVSEATNLILEAQELCKNTGLRLHKFNSNRKDILSCVAPSERATTCEALKLNPDSTPEGQVLGIQWSIENDTFSFSIDIKDQPSTRRGILSVVTSLYEPLGFIALFILSGKCILRELCCRGISWDEVLPESLSPWWEAWKRSWWKKEYLMSVSTRQKWHTPRHNLKVNDIVVIKEDMSPRCQWQLGHMIKTTIEKDGIVCRIKVLVDDRRLQDKKDHLLKPPIIEHPIQKLVVLIESK
ncbi:Hypothetical predicted protein [Pelobates cultripes]|uniref:DUF5641 domain-containing protein n=1 Tax=Pelobates cultripes TaxID=61616 RepID=A0AAD1W0S7_PELCU|nr:Hypothetical predicted protein [Pelobates cultripes]